MQGQVSAPMEVPGAELDFGASPSSGQTGNATGPASVAHSSQGQQSGWTPGHRNRESRSSISSLSGWGTSAFAHFIIAITRLMPSRS